METAPNERFAKDTDGFFARHFDRKISGAVSRWLIRTPVTPNQITLGVTVLGIFAGVAMAGPGYPRKLVGALLFLATSILDGCDGEVARAKKKTSRLGGWLDFWGDNVVHVAVFFGLGVGLFQDSQSAVHLWLGGAAAFGTLVSASLAAYQTSLKTKSAGFQASQGVFTSVVGDARSHSSAPAWQKRLVALSDALARRDFVYGVVVLALIGRLVWFLWACAIGVNLYALTLLALLSLRRRAG